MNPRRIVVAVVCIVNFLMFAVGAQAQTGNCGANVTMSPAAPVVGQSVAFSATFVGSVQYTQSGTLSVDGTQVCSGNNGCSGSVPSLTEGAHSYSWTCNVLPPGSGTGSGSGAFTVFPTTGPTGTGFPAFAALQQYGPGAINLGNLNVHYDMTIAKQERGIPLNFGVHYDSAIYGPGLSWPLLWGWRYGESSVGYVTYSTAFTCPSDSSATNYGNWIYVEGNGTQHPFPPSMVISSDANCFEGTQQTDMATDQSGYSITVSNGKVTSLKGPDGTNYEVKAVSLESVPENFPVVTGNYNADLSSVATIIDRNGNYNTAGAALMSGNTSSLVFDDTNGSVSFYATPTYTSDGHLQSVSYNYLQTNGGTVAPVTLNFTVFPGVVTAFQCPGTPDIAVYNDPNTPGNSGVALPTSMVYPDGSQYSFTYETTPGNATYRTGRLASVTLPTGGVISYSYPGTNGGIFCSDGTTANMTRTTPDGTWTYARTETGSASTTTMTDPQGNQTVYTFQNGFQVEQQVYQGSAASGTILDTRLTCYNSNTNSATCASTAVQAPITQEMIFDVLPNGEESATKMILDQNSGTVTEQDDYDYGNGTYGSLLKTTLTQYDSLGNNLLTFPASVTVKDGSGNQVSQTTYGYDEGTLTATSNVPNHQAVIGSRGNQTSVHRWLNTSPNTTLNSTMTYNDTGVALTSVDPNNNTTTYGVNNNTGQIPSVTYPATNSVAHTETYNYDGWTNLLTSTVDQNGQKTSYNYDAMLRMNSVSYPDGGIEEIKFPTTNQIQTQTAISGPGGDWTMTSTTELLDGLGRVVRTETANGETTPYDQQDTCYNSLGQVAFKSYPYQGSGFSGTSKVCSGAGGSYTYDALGRVTSVTHSDGSSVQVAYAGRTVQITEEGNGSFSPSRIIQHDALGRTVATCEVSSTTFLGNSGVPASCGLDLAGTGFLTSYTYDALSNLTSVAQGALNPRTFTYDSLSRLVSATDPESGMATYTYDSNGNMLTRTRPLENQSNPASTVTATNTYDALNRVTQTSYNDGITPTAHFSYDTSSGWGSPPVTQNNLVGRMSEAWVTPNAGGAMFAGQIFGYDAMGRVTVNNQCTPYTSSCGSSSYPVSYTYDLAGDMASIANGAGVTLSYSYNIARRLTGMTSSLNDASHPGTLLSNVHYSPAQYTDSLGNGLADTMTLTPRGMVSSEIVEQTGLAPSTNDGEGSVAINGSLQSKQISGAAATGSVTVCGSDEYVSNFNTYDFGSIKINFGSYGIVQVSYGSNQSASTLASQLVSDINGGNFPVTASLSGSTVLLTAKSAGTSGNGIPLSVSVSSNATQWNGQSYTCTSASGSTLSGGKDAVTKYDSGACTITVNGHSDNYSWSGSATTAASIASGLVSAINGDGNAVVNASQSGLSTVAMTAKQTNVTYPLSASCTWDTADFSTGSFTTQDTGAVNGTQLALPVYWYSLNQAPDGRITGASDLVNGNWAVTGLTGSVVQTCTNGMFGDSLSCSGTSTTPYAFTTTCTTRRRAWSTPCSGSTVRYRDGGSAPIRRAGLWRMPRIRKAGTGMRM